MKPRIAFLCAAVTLIPASHARADTQVSQQDGTWRIESDSIRVSADPRCGSIRVLDKASGYEWKQPNERRDASGPPRFRRARRRAAGKPGIAFEVDLGKTGDRPNTVTVSLAAPNGSGRVIVTTDMPDRSVEAHRMPFLDPFILDTPTGALAVADYCNGHVYPVDGYPNRHAYHAADRLDMPWAGLCDLERGFGWLMIIDTSDDAHVHFKHYPVGDKKLVAPKVIWVSSKRKFAYARRLIYQFIPKGGYVAMAKAFREYARAKGLLVTLAEKARANPNVKRLFGAPDVWGDAALTFAQQARSAGVEKMLIHGRSTPEQTRAINELGFLTSEYDNYTDILPLEPGKELDNQHAPLPDSAALKADGKRMTAWLTFDKKRQYMKRCPSLWVETAKVVVPKVLGEFPYVGRFIDVTTAEGLYECFDAKHPLTKGQKRQCGVDLLSYVRSLNLVVGGEHGIWWAVPHLDYIEGMMSGSPWCYPWPAGHLIHPESKDQAFESPWGGKLAEWALYETWSIGHRWRAPLWELVFHDCIVSTWYWGDASDWLLAAAPEITPKKDAFNILYGTIPMMWANRQGSWQADRELFLRTYRNTCKLHEVIAGTEMVSHEFVTPDRHVQRTRFSDGTEAVVNFGPEPHAATVGGRRHLLPQNGFALKGPRIAQSLALVDGKPVTNIKADGYLFTDADGVALTVKVVGPDRLAVTVRSSGQDKTIAIRPASVLSNWDPTSTRVYALDADGQRRGHVPWRSGSDGAIHVDPLPKAASLDVVCRSEAERPDLTFGTKGIHVTPSNPKQGHTITASVDVLNVGGVAASDVHLGFYVDARRPTHRLADRTLDVAPGQRTSVVAEIDTSHIDGPRRIIAVVDPANAVAELCERNNRAAAEIEISPDLGRWSHRRALQVDAGALARRDEPVVVPINLPGADPGSVRVATCDGQGRPAALVPAQFDVVEGGQCELCFVMTGETAARTRRRFVAIWNDAAKAKTRRCLPPSNTMWDESARVIEGETYRVTFRDGVPVDVAAKREGVVGEPFLAKLICSSKETGWTDEPGTVEAFEVLAAGPVRTRIRVRKALKAGVVYEKTYTFYPRFFDVHINVNKPAGGLYSRGFYSRCATFVDNEGRRGQIDGKGEAEGVYGVTKRPKWFAVFAADWAHSGVALSGFDHLSYWDGPDMGGVGFVSKGHRDIRMRYVIRPGGTGHEFAKQDAARALSPVTVTLE